MDQFWPDGLVYVSRSYLLPAPTLQPKLLFAKKALAHFAYTRGFSFMMLHLDVVCSHCAKKTWKLPKRSLNRIRRHMLS